MYAVNVYQKCVISRVCNHKSMCASLSLSLRRYVDPHVQKPTHQTNVPSRIRGETHYLSIDLSIYQYAYNNNDDNNNNNNNNNNNKNNNNEHTSRAPFHVKHAPLR